MKLKSIIFFASICCVIFVTAIVIIYFSMHTSSTPSDVIIPSGVSVSIIADTLIRHDIIVSKTIFLLAVKLRQIDNQIQSGIFRLPSSISIHEMIHCLITGKHRINNFTVILEGITSKEIASLLKRTFRLDSTEFISFMHDKIFIKSLGLHSTSLEGYLMPDTYLFPVHAQPKEIIRILVNTYHKKITDSMREQMRNSGKSENVILTIASIVESETAIDSERAIIAGVYYNRLKRGIKLQADPTIQYIIQDAPRRLYFKDLAIDSPFNTYLYEGLPPTPINNPGLKSILAALNPVKHDYIYFVANGKGGHTFSTSLKEHEIAVSAYRKIQKDEQ